MREILFRGKTRTGEWVQGDYEHFEADGITYPMISVWGELNEDVILETVGQYTGLTDKNGKMIFEGDVVKAYDDTYDNGFAEVKGKVFFNYGSFDIDVEDVGYIPLYSYGTENIEVIGNSHDDGELLKGE